MEPILDFGCGENSKLVNYFKFISIWSG